MLFQITTCSFTRRNKMDKAQLLKTLAKFEEKFNLKPSDYHLTHGGSLVLMGFKDTTNDADITIHDIEKFKEVAKQGGYKTQLPSGTWLVNIMDNVDIHNPLPDKDVELTETCGILHTTVKQTLQDKLELDREKDQHWIGILATHLEMEAARNDMGCVFDAPEILAASRMKLRKMGITI